MSGFGSGVALELRGVKSAIWLLSTIPEDVIILAPKYLLMVLDAKLVQADKGWIQEEGNKTAPH